MKSAFRNLAVVITILFFCVGGAWVVIRQRSLSEGVKAPVDHPFVKFEGTKIVGLLDPKSTAPAFEQYDRLSKLSPDLILWIDLAPKLEGGVFLASTIGEGQTPIKMNDVITRYPNHQLILNFSLNQPGMEEELMRELDAVKAGDRVLIQSPEDGLLKDVRSKKALWVYGTSDAQVVQLKMLSTIGLASASSIRGDVLVIGHPVSTRPELHFSPEDVQPMLQEGHRRLMKVFSGPAHTKEEALELKRMGVDGILTSTPEDLL